MLFHVFIMDYAINGILVMETNIAP